MIGIYFSGTGNTKYCVERFVNELADNMCDETNPYSRKTYSIEDESLINIIKQSEDIVFGYPVYFSSMPKLVRDFIDNNSELWKGKNIFVIVTMGLFSGDGSGVMARLLKKH